MGFPFKWMSGLFKKSILNSNIIPKWSSFLSLIKSENSFLHTLRLLETRDNKEPLTDGSTKDVSSRQPTSDFAPLLSYIILFIFFSPQFENRSHQNRCCLQRTVHGALGCSPPHLNTSFGSSTVEAPLSLPKWIMHTYQAVPLKINKQTSAWVKKTNLTGLLLLKTTQCLWLNEYFVHSEEGEVEMKVFLIAALNF